MAFTCPDIEVITRELESAGDALSAQGGSLAWGVFRRGGPGLTSNADVPYRIASMTKSFTAAAIGSLAAKGLDLDMPFHQIVPGLAGTAIADRTCRQALTMGTGFTKDDPWADRMEAMTSAELMAYLNRGATPIAPADTGFEYSNLGYALLGLVAESVTGEPFIDTVTTEILHPFGLSSTGFDHADFPDLAPAIRLDRCGRGHRAELTGPGVFSPIGGVISTVSDIRTWMDAHLDALDRLSTDQADSWSRILSDNQQPHRLVEVARSEHHVETVSYGFGLQHRLDSRLGRVVCHSGGYPGYGSHMRWFPDLDLSVVVLGNTTYYPAERMVRDAVDAGWTAAAGTPGARVERTATSVPVPYFPAQPAQAEAVLQAANLVVDFDATRADELFAMNMDLDEPRDERRERFAAWRDDRDLSQAFTLDDVEMTTPLRGTVTVSGDDSAPAGASGTITVSLDHLGAVQTITLSS